MRKAILFLFIIFTFGVGLAGIYLFAQSRRVTPAVSLPVPPVEVSPSPSPILSPAAPPALAELENDLQLIEADLKKMKEDSRLNPPSFIFNLGLD